jgi:hypothetical protein
MLDRLLAALIASKNEAADDALLEALRLGVLREQQIALDALLKRQTVRGMGGVIGQYAALPEALQLQVLENIRAFYHALRECGRTDEVPLRLAALKLIALGRQGKLAYVLSENLHNSNETLSKSATEAMVALARWIATETRGLQRSDASEAPKDAEPPATPNPSRAAAPARSTHPVGSTNPARSANPARAFSSPSGNWRGPIYRELMDQRPEIEAAVARALDVHRGRHGADLLRAALLLCDWPGSKTLAILSTSKHGGQSPLVRRLQQPPASEQVEAFLLGASHGQLRSHFGIAFSHIDEAPVLDAVLRKTHWLKDHQLQLCLHQVNRGTWWGDGELLHDIERRTPDDAARIGEWLAASGSHDVMQDERMDRLRQHAKDSFPARLRLLRIAARRKRGSSVLLLRKFLEDSDERLVRMAAREIVRRRPADFENMLLQLMTGAAESVRKVISRSIGQAGFEHFWQKFDRLNKPTRKQAGRAMLKILPDAVQRLQRRLTTGPVEHRLKAMQMTHELGLGEPLRAALLQLCADPNPKLRSKAVAVAGEVPSVGPELLIDRLLNDTDARVRANTVEVLDARKDVRFLPILAQRARAANNRERANAIKAMHTLRVGSASTQLLGMLRDKRSEHRISALWALRQIGWWQLLNEVGRLAKEDENIRVRRYALGVLRNVAEMAQNRRLVKAG